MLFRKAHKRRHRSLRGKSSAIKKKVQPARTRRKVRSTTVKKKRRTPARKTTVKRIKRRHRHDLAATTIRHNPLAQTAPAAKRFLQKIIRLLLIIILVFSAYSLASHPALQITNIKITGTKAISQDDISQTITSVLKDKIFGVFPSKHYLFVPLKEIQSVVTERFPVDNVSVQKMFPGSLVITIEEQVSSIIYDNTAQYFLVDRQGKIMEPIRNVAPYEWHEQTKERPSTTEDIAYEDLLHASIHVPDVASFYGDFEGLPIIVDGRPTTLVEDVSGGNIHREIVSSTLHWQRMFERHNLSFAYLEITDPRAEQAVIYGKEGRIYLVSFSHESTPQLAKIHTVLEDHPNAMRIDVRFPARVYWE